MNEKHTSRRRFLKTTAGTAALGYAGIGNAASKNSGSHFMRVGLVGLETSPRACEMARAINARAMNDGSMMQITAVYVDQSSASISRAQETLRTLGVETLVNSPEELIPLVDCAIIFGAANTSRFAKPLFEAGKPLYIAPPFARSMAETRDLLDMAHHYNVPVISCGPLTMMSEVLGVAAQVDQSIIQQYYLHGDAGTWFDSMSDMLDLARTIIGGKIARCAAHGNIDSGTPVITTIEHEALTGRDPAIGSMLTFREKHDRYWAKVHLDNDVIEEGIHAEPGAKHHFERMWFPFLDAVEAAFKSGKPVMTPEKILDSTAAILMAYASSRADGMPVGINDIEQVTLQGIV